MGRDDDGHGGRGKVKGENGKVKGERMSGERFYPPPPPTGTLSEPDV